MIRIDHENCIGCGACVDVCNVTKVFQLSDGKAQAVHPGRCWQCGQCVAVCPVDAVQHEIFPIGKSPLAGKTPGNLNNISTILRQRRSTRTYKKNSVGREVVEKAICAARWAPSAKNYQAVSWVVVDNPAIINELLTNTIRVLSQSAQDLRYQAQNNGSDPEKNSRTLSEAKSLEHLYRRYTREEDPLFFNAPILLFGITPISRFGRDDAVIAGFTIQLAAVQLGLATCQIGYFTAALLKEKNLAKDLLKIPEDHVIQIALTMGYPMHPVHRLIDRNPHAIRWAESSDT